MATYEYVLADTKSGDAHDVDPARVYITGFSMGGGGSAEAVWRFPGKFAAVVPVAGGGTSRTKGEALKDTPMWMFCGSKDGIQPEYCRTVIRAVRKAGGSPRYTEYRGLKHDIYERAYNQPGLFEWLFRQSLK